MEAKARGLAGLEANITNLPDPTPEPVIGATSCGASSSRSHVQPDLPARPLCHHNGESIKAHLTIVFAALAVTRLVETRTGWTITGSVSRAVSVSLAAGVHIQPHGRTLVSKHPRLLSSAAPPEPDG